MCSYRLLYQLTKVNIAQGSKIVLVRSYLRVPQTAGQVKILLFLVKFKFPPIYANNFCDAGQVPILRYFEACSTQNKRHQNTVKLKIQQFLKDQVPMAEKIFRPTHKIVVLIEFEKLKAQVNLLKFTDSSEPLQILYTKYGCSEDNTVQCKIRQNEHLEATLAHMLYYQTIMFWLI